MSANKKRLVASALIATTLAITGCSSDVVRKRPTYESASANPFIPTNRQAATTLAAQAKSRLDPAQPILIATIVDVNALEYSSTAGRIISEQVSAGFTAAGYTMIEMKFRNSVYMKRSEGELLLTREISEAAKFHKAQAVIVGVYGEASQNLFINLKVVQPITNTVLSAYDYALPMDEDVRILLAQCYQYNSNNRCNSR